MTSADNVVLWLRHHVLQPLGAADAERRDAVGDAPSTLLKQATSDFGYWSETSGADGRRQSLNDSGVLARPSNSLTARPSLSALPRRCSPPVGAWRRGCN